MKASQMYAHYPRGSQYIDEESGGSLWKNRTGVCASWALVIANEISGNDWTYADNAQHQVAYSEIGVLIDSSMRSALRLQPGKRVKARNITWEMAEVEGKHVLSLVSPRNLMLDLYRAITDHTMQKHPRCDGAQFKALPEDFPAGCLQLVEHRLVLPNQQTSS